MRRTSAKIPKNGHFRQFEGDVAPMTDDLCADLDQLLLELRQRMSALGLVSRASPVQTAARNCMGSASLSVLFDLIGCASVIIHVDANEIGLGSWAECAGIGRRA